MPNDEEWNDAERVLRAHARALIAVPGVVGTAIGTDRGKPCIRVFVADAAVVERGGIPGTLEGIRVKIQVSGRFDARTR